MITWCLFQVKNRLFLVASVVLLLCSLLLVLHCHVEVVPATRMVMTYVAYSGVNKDLSHNAPQE